LQQDAIYSVPKGEYHSSEIPQVDQPAVTLMRKYNIDERVPPINVIPLGKPAESSFDLKKISQAEAWQLLQEAIDALS
jgi:hypothetical protein